jgi:hypothetical protein
LSTAVKCWSYWVEGSVWINTIRSQATDQIIFQTCLLWRLVGGPPTTGFMKLLFYDPIGQRHKSLPVEIKIKTWPDKWPSKSHVETQGVH